MLNIQWLWVPFTAVRLLDAYIEWLDQTMPMLPDVELARSVWHPCGLTKQFVTLQVAAGAEHHEVAGSHQVPHLLCGGERCSTAPDMH